MTIHEEWSVHVSGRNANRLARRAGAPQRGPAPARAARSRSPELRDAQIAGESSRSKERAGDLVAHLRGALDFADEAEEGEVGDVERDLAGGAGEGGEFDGVRVDGGADGAAIQRQGVAGAGEHERTRALVGEAHGHEQAGLKRGRLQRAHIGDGDRDIVGGGARCGGAAGEQHDGGEHTEKGD